MAILNTIDIILELMNKKQIQIIWRDCSPDNPPCVICKKIITDMPLRMWNDNPKKQEIAFHFKCIHDLGISIEPIPESEFLMEDSNNFVFVECSVCKKFESCNLVSNDEKTKIKNLSDKLRKILKEN